MPSWPNVDPGTQQNEIMDWLHERGPAFAPTTVEVADFLGFPPKYTTKSGTTSWGANRAGVPLQVLERKGLVERVGKGKRGRGGYVCWRRTDMEPLRDFATDHREHLLSHKVQSVRFRRLEDRVAELEGVVAALRDRTRGISSG